MNRQWTVVCWVIGAGLLGCGTVQNADTKNAKLPRLVVQTGHRMQIKSVAFSPYGRTVVSASRDNTLILWDALTGKELRTLMHGHEVNGVTFSPDGRTVVSSSRGDKTIKFWNVTTGRELHSFRGYGPVAFSPDGKTLVSVNESGTLILRDVATGRELSIFKGHKSYVSSVAFSPDGKTLVSGSSDYTLKLWDVITGRELRSVSGCKYCVVTSVAFSPDGKSVVSGSDDSTIRLWDAATGRELRVLGHSNEDMDVEASVAFSSDGKTVVSGSLGVLKLWDVVTGRELRTLATDGDIVASAAFSPDGKTVVSGSWFTIKFWDVATGRELRSLGGYGTGITSIAVSPNGKTVVSGGEDNTIKRWNLTTGQGLISLKGRNYVKTWLENVASVAFSPDGKTVISGSWDTTLKQWDITTGQELQTFPGHNRGRVTTVDFSPDGKTIASGSDESPDVELWDVIKRRKLRVLKGRNLPSQMDDGVQSVAFSPAGKTIAGSYDQTIKLWDMATGQELRSVKGRGKIAFSPDGKILASGSEKNALNLWDVATGRELFTLKGHESWVSSVAFSPDGKAVVSGSGDNTLKVWDVATGREIRSLSGHSDQITGIAFSPNGQILVSGSSDKTLKFWHVADGALLATLISFSDDRWAITDPEGRFDIADLEDMPYLHWVMPDDPMTPLPIEIFMRDYYEPRLLPRILNGEKFKPVRALGELNRVQPEVKIIGIEPEPKQPGYVKVTVEAVGASRAYPPEGKPIATAVHDLRLFRNGQLVGHAEGKLAEAGGKPFQRSFRVRLPSGKKSLNFTAYAFNDDRVKSATAQQTYISPETIATGKPRVYLITLGVNRHDNPVWNLHYAANDARLIGQSLATRLTAKADYEAVVTLPLISDAEGRNLATKANLKAVLDALAGRKADVSAIPGGEQLRQATPDDLVLISFSGHGYEEDGLFYLIPGDTGLGRGREITPELTAHAISSDELSAWLKDVDAGDMAMIVDACHSAASVGDEFKPGPMGGRGLGQLAFDKGMRILAASQADDVALESDLIKQGLLSFALVQDGLDREQADYKPKDKKITLEEWLSYGVSRVPSLAEEVKAGKVKAVRGADDGRGMMYDSEGKPMTQRVIQQPALFDFTKGRRDVVLETGLKRGLFD